MTDGGDGDWGCANVLSWFVRSCLSVDWWHYQSLLYMYLESSDTALYIRNMSDSIIWCCQDERREKSGDWPHLREGETERRYKWCDGRRLSVSRAQAVLELTPPAGLSSPWPGSRSAAAPQHFTCKLDSGYTRPRPLGLHHSWRQETERQLTGTTGAERREISGQHVPFQRSRWPLWSRWSQQSETIVHWSPSPWCQTT